MQESKLVLVTGTTEYIGDRLVPALLEAGYPVRCLVRDPEHLQGRSWSDQVEVVEADALNFFRVEAIEPGREYVAQPPTFETRS